MTDPEAISEPIPTAGNVEPINPAPTDASPVEVPDSTIPADPLPEPGAPETSVLETRALETSEPETTEVSSSAEKVAESSSPEGHSPEPLVAEVVTPEPAPGAVEVTGPEVVPEQRPAPVPVNEIGKILTGVVTSVDSKEVELALRDLRTGVIYRRAIDEAQTDPTTVFSVGDTAEGIELTRDDPKSRVVLSRAWAIKTKKWNKITEAKEAGELLEGEVTGISGKGLVVDIGVRGFVPASHLELDPVEDLSPYVGQTLALKVLDVDVARERVVLSRRSVLMKEARKAAHDALAALEVGSVVTGTVASIASYGAFVDVGGVNGLVHLSECSWARVRSAKEVVKVGDSVQVKILDVKIKKKRVSLSIRQVGEDPMVAVVPGSIVEGPVTRLVDFGAFVDLGGVEGLVHLSELAEYRVFSASDIVFPGETIRVKVLSVNKKKRRIELSVRQAANPFD